jgi:hypothetical protein
MDSVRERVTTHRNEGPRQHLKRDETQRYTDIHHGVEKTEEGIPCATYDSRWRAS